MASLKFLVIADSMGDNLSLPSTHVKVFDSARSDDRAIRKCLRSIRTAQFDHIIFMVGANDLKMWGGEPAKTAETVCPFFKTLFCQSFWK